LNLKREQRAKRDLLIKRIQEIDMIAETKLLTFVEWEERISLEDEIDKSDRLEEFYWKQRAGKNGSCWGILIPTIIINLPMVEGGRTLSLFLTLIKGRSGVKMRLLPTLLIIIKLCLGLVISVT